MRLRRRLATSSDSGCEPHLEYRSSLFCNSVWISHSHQVSELSAVKTVKSLKDCLGHSPCLTVVKEVRQHKRAGQLEPGPFWHMLAPQPEAAHATVCLGCQQNLLSIPSAPPIREPSCLMLHHEEAPDVKCPHSILCS